MHKLLINIILVSVVLFVLVSADTLAQCPTTNFTIQSNACKGENITITNTTTGATRVEWDLCPGDLALTPTSLTNVQTLSANVPAGINLVSDGGNWYGFVTSRNNNKIFRLDFGTSIESTPTIVDLGSIGGSLSSPESMEFIKEGSNWYALLMNLNGGVKKLARLSFGSSLTSTPTVTNLITIGTSVACKISINKDSDSTIVAVTDYTTNTISLIHFKGSITYNPTGADVITTAAIPSASNLRDISIIEECGVWYGVAIAYSSRTLHRLTFGKRLFSTPAVALIPTVSPLASGNNPSNVDVRKEGGKVYAFISTYSGNVFRLDFGTSITNSPTSTNMGTLGGLANIWAEEIVNEKSKWYGFFINDVTNKFIRINFPSTCYSNISWSTQTTPPPLVYSQSGTYNVTLTAFDANGNSSNVTKTVTVANNDAPQLDFIKNTNECVSSQIGFTAVDIGLETVTQWNWSFGDPGSGVNNTSVSQTPSHQFSSPGTYTVKLQAQSGNGCNNFITKEVTIYDETTPDFSAPLGTLCSNAPLTFTNSSTKETGSHVKWLWDFGDGKTDTAKVPTHTYEEGGIYNVTLTGGVLGCSASITKQISITQGPKTGFKFQNICLGETTVFTDTTKGVGLLEWEWNFGDGNTSTNQSPVNIYNSIGTYNVTLKVKNTNGCEVTKIQQIRIHDLPAVDFLPPPVICNGDSLKFQDQSTLSDGNISTWKWELFNEQGTKLDQKIGKKDVNFLFPVPGKYSIIETVTSEAGCSKLITKNFDVLKAPEIDIKISNICLGDSALLEGISKIAGQNITAWTWEISDGGLHMGQNPKHKFTAAGKYTIYLTAVSSNNCPTVVTKELTIFHKPVASFASSNNCLNAPVQFADSSKVIGGTITEWLWNFDGLGTSNIKNPQFTFTKAGSHAISLTVTSSQGCTYTTTKNITIQGLPVAGFSFEPEVGPPPFEVQFNNSTTGASQYTWNFGDGGKSTLKSPIYTYNELGVYSIDMIAFNQYGCSDTLTKIIRVMPPSLTVHMERILVSTLTEELAFAIEVKNTGSRIIKSIEFIIDFGGALSFKETWTGILNPEEKVTYPLRTQLIKQQLSKVKYLCISANEINGEIYSNSDNKICVNLAEQFLVFGPTPNPSRRDVEFSYTLPTSPVENSFEINFYSTSGQKINFTPSNYIQGFNENTLDISSLQPGLYMVEFIFNGERVLKRVLIY